MLSWILGYLLIDFENPYFLTISYPASTKLANKTSNFLGILAAVKSPYSVESLSAPVFVEKKSTVEGSLKSFKNMQGRKLQFEGL